MKYITLLASLTAVAFMGCTCTSNQQFSKDSDKIAVTGVSLTCATDGSVYLFTYSGGKAASLTRF